MTAAPAWVRNGRADVLAANELGRALYWPVFDRPRRPGPTRPASPSWTRGRPEFFADWERTASDIVAVLRAEAGRNPLRQGPHRPRSANSPPAARSSAPGGPPTTCSSTAAAASGCATPSSATSTSTYEAMDLTSTPGLTLLVYTAEPGSATPTHSSSWRAGPRRRWRRSAVVAARARRLVLTAGKPVQAQTPHQRAPIGCPPRSSEASSQPDCAYRRPGVPHVRLLDSSLHPHERPHPMPGLIELTRARRRLHRTASAMTRSTLPRLDSW